MSWYSVGLVDVVVGSNSVTGADVDFTANVRVGDAFLGPDGRWYEIVNVPDASHITISPNYLGTTVAGQGYKIVPVQGYVKASADQLREATIDLTGRLEALDLLDADELAALDGATGNIQDQLDTKINSNTALVNTTASFTTALYEKLEALEEDAAANVNADWDATSGDAQILNKPVLVAIATSGSAADLIAGIIGDSRLPSTMADKTFTGVTVLPTTTSIGTTSAVELSYLGGVNAPIQEQFSGKQPLNSALTGTTASFTIDAQAKLNNIQSGATFNSSDSFLISRANHTGTQPQSTILNLTADLAGKQPITTVLTNTTAAFTTELASKLVGIQSSATMNSTDAALLSRSNHTGTQLAETISDFEAVVADQLVTTFIEGSNVTLTHDPEASTITISATGSGGGGGGGSDTDLSVARTSTQVTVESSTGTSAILVGADATNAGILTASNYSKLSGIATAATANQTDSYLVSRSNHTGTQAQSTITGLVADLATKQTVLVSATNIKTVNGVSILGSGNISVDTSPFDSSTDPFILDTYLLALAAQ